MSACDTCPVPGHCCRFMYLSGVRSGRGLPEGENIAEATDHLKEMGVPMLPLFKNSKGGWAVWCPNLDQKTGKCLDYENRPDLCKDFEPGSAPLCILHVPTWSEPNEGCGERPQAAEDPGPGTGGEAERRAFLARAHRNS